MQIILANPRGFCAGVDRAIAIVERALEKFGAPIYVRHEVVHNKFVCDDLRSKGAIFIDELADVPSGSTVIFSAHGVSKAVRHEAEARGLKIFDATCPLVTKVHLEVARMRKEGREIIMIGHKGHPEVEGTMGQSRTACTSSKPSADVHNWQVETPAQLAYVTQTTLSVDDAAQVIAALKERFPANHRPEEGRHLLRHAEPPGCRQATGPGISDVVLVVGSKSSSNSNRLREVAELLGSRAYLIDQAEQIDPAMARPAPSRVGVTAGASAPEVLVRKTSSIDSPTAIAASSNNSTAPRKTSSSRCRANCSNEQQTTRSHRPLDPVLPADESDPVGARFIGRLLR
jgi:4-hydroxy-3-methylbut-2-enyl diphosphate reductase